jgi:D-methionine transport system ATP-binding protein
VFEVIQLQNIRKRFLRPDGSWFDVIDHVSLQVQQGEIFGLIGSSGAGKSTLLRTIPLLARPDTGSVVVDGCELTTLSQRELRRVRQNLGFVFQQFNLMANRTVAGNVAFPLEITGLSRKEIDKRVAECLHIVKLSDRAEHYPAQLSGGQKQRAGIARALAPNPKIILADEPTSSLDPLSAESILKCLKDINVRFGVTIVIVTHEMKVVQSICDKAAVLEEGKVLEIVDLAEAKHLPSLHAQTILEAA